MRTWAIRKLFCFKNLVRGVARKTTHMFGVANLVAFVRFVPISNRATRLSRIGSPLHGSRSEFQVTVV
jgi:hypothetical protein